MSRILILYASLGGGHLSAARALGAAFESYPSNTVQIEDALAYVNPLLKRGLTETYRQLSENAPNLYRLYYENTAADTPERRAFENRLLGLLERPFLSDLETLIGEVQPDAVITVQQIPGRLIEQLETRTGHLVPHYVVITDIDPHTTWLAASADGFFVASDLTATLMQQRGVAPDLIHVTGIPIRLEISQPKPRAAMRERHALPADQPVLTLMGGGILPERVHSIVEHLLTIQASGALVVVAGRNDELRAALADLDSTATVELRTLGHIDYLDDLVAASDLVVGKAGGLTVSEVLGRGVPMVIVDPLPGQEEWNADAVVASGGGIQMRLPEMVPMAVARLLANPERLAAMRAWAEHAARPRAALTVARTVLDDLQRRGNA